MAENKDTTGTKRKSVRPIVTIAVVSLLVCGLIFPLVVTGVAQLLFPYQAGGEIQYVNGQPVGSEVAVNYTDYTLPFFFHLRNDTASGFDPDITLQEALSQIPGISSATGINQSALQTIVDQNVQGTWWIFGNPYVNAQKLNLLLISDYPQMYAKFLG